MAEHSQVPPTSATAPPPDAPTVSASPMPPSTPQPYADEPLMPPVGGFLAQDFNRDSLASGAPSSYNRMSSGWNSRTSVDERGLLPAAAATAGGAATPESKNEPDTVAPAEAVEPKRRKRPVWIILAIIAALALVAVAIGLGVYFGVVKNKKSSGSSGDHSGGDPAPTPDDSNPDNSTVTPPPPSVLLTGSDGSEVEMEDGTKFIYNNSFSGFWYYDKENPLSGPTGQANSWTTPVNETWRWGVDKQRGVNLGGWLVLEPFISPAPFEQYWPDAVDEFTLSTLMAADTANGGLNQLEDHYKTFITEQDFANIAAAGLNWIRLPVPFWAISKLPNEPFLEHTAWTYFVKAIVWARKYGLRINLDLHTLPGSQNGWNHSGKLGENFNWMRGVMGVANGQRALDVIRVYTEFICKPEVANIVPMFGIANEPRGMVIGETPLKTFYLEAYRVIREVSGIGQGPAVSFHTGFLDGSFDRWVNADRVMLDRHPYLVFAGSQTQDGPLERAMTVCGSFGDFVNTTNANFGLNSAGEWSASVNDCGLYLNNVGVPADYDTEFGAGSCDTWNHWEDWTDDRKADMIHYVSAQMDMLKDYFFWTWRIGASTRNGNRILTSQWSYELGWRNGWIPADPRTADGECARLGSGIRVPWDGEFQPYQTTGEGGSLTPTGSGGQPWPPASLDNVADASQLPVYSPTGPLPTLIAEGAPAALATFTPEMGGQGMMVPIAGCDYPDQYDANDVAIPTGCTL